MVKSKTAKIRRVGNSLGATLPKAMLDELNLEEGSSVTAVHTKNGILLTPSDDVFARGMEAYHEFATQYRNALRELAK